MWMWRAGRWSGGREGAVVGSVDVAIQSDNIFGTRASVATSSGTSQSVSLSIFTHRRYVSGFHNTFTTPK